MPAGLHWQVCKDDPELLKRVGENWVQLSGSPSVIAPGGSYVGEMYVHPSSNLGCDTRGCSELSERWFDAQEYIEVGHRAAPKPDKSRPNLPAANKPKGEVPVFERRSLSGPLAVHVRYFDDAQCGGSPKDVMIPVP